MAALSERPTQLDVEKLSSGVRCIHMTFFDFLGPISRSINRQLKETFENKQEEKLLHVSCKDVK